MTWLDVSRGEAPLVIAFPHAGTDLADIADGFVAPWLARRDTGWWVDMLDGPAGDPGAAFVRTGISRSVIDVNRDPSGASLYPGQATTELCPITTFDGQALYLDLGPEEAEISRRRVAWFDPYHDRLAAEIERLRHLHPKVVVYDAHSIRSRIPRLFESELPEFNIGTNGGATCDPALSAAIVKLCRDSGRSTVLDGRFKGGWTTRHYGRPEEGVHAIQMELSIRAYLDEPEEIDEANWPPPFDASRAAPLQATLRNILQACLAFAKH